MSRDPVALAMVQNRLDTITRHMGWVMTRTARSPIFSQSHDFSCFICAPDGILVSCADGIPIHTGGGGFAVRALLRAFAGRIGPGDAFLLNDPYEAGGNHLPDWVVARPVHVEGELVGFCCNRAHQSDIGGGAAGTYNPAATEIFHEGIRLPPLRLVEAGVVRDDLWQLLLLNTRTPELMDGDLRAMLGSTRIGAERVSELVEDLGTAAFLHHVEGVLDHADRRFRDGLRTLRPGRYLGEEVMDNDCFEQVDVAIRLAVTVEPDGAGITVDFTGTDAQIRGFKNSSVANTASAVYVALASFLEPDIPRNEGTFRSVRIIAPEGSVVNPRPPAPLTMCTVFCAHEIIHALWKALAEADPARACAGWGKSVHGITAGGVPGATGPERSFVLYHWHGMAAAGATRERDGFNQLGHLIALGGLEMPDLEVYEQQFPIRYRRWEFRQDSGGPGRRRGGTGVHYEADVVAPGSWSFRGEGVDTPSSWGVGGGGAGAAGALELHPLGEDGRGIDGELFRAPKYGLRRFGPVRLRAVTPGGGGWGNPLDRDPAAVLRDVLDGVVSGQAALGVYGVVLTTDRRRGGTPSCVDEAATAELRASARGRGDS